MYLKLISYEDRNHVHVCIYHGEHWSFEVTDYNYIRISVCACAVISH